MYHRNQWFSKLESSIQFGPRIFQPCCWWHQRYMSNNYGKSPFLMGKLAISMAIFFGNHHVSVHLCSPFTISVNLGCGSSLAVNKTDRNSINVSSKTDESHKTSHIITKHANNSQKKHQTCHPKIQEYPRQYNEKYPKNPNKMTKRTPWIPWKAPHVRGQRIWNGSGVSVSWFWYVLMTPMVDLDASWVINPDICWYVDMHGEYIYIYISIYIYLYIYIWMMFFCWNP